MKELIWWHIMYRLPSNVVRDGDGFVKIQFDRIT